MVSVARKMKFVNIEAKNRRNKRKKKVDTINLTWTAENNNKKFCMLFFHQFQMFEIRIYEIHQQQQHEQDEQVENENEN